MYLRETLSDTELIEKLKGVINKILLEEQKRINDILKIWRNKVYEKANKILKIHPAIGLKAHILSQRKMQHYQLYYERMYKYYYLPVGGINLSW